MPDAAPRIDRALISARERLDDPSQPIAETHRRVADLAELLGLSRPSYEQVRVHVHELRFRRRERKTLGPVLLDVMFRVRPFEAILHEITDTGPYSGGD
jgi:hypothetical protein